MPQRLSDLAATVQTAYQQYGQLSYLREPLKATFVLTLSLVLLMALLAAVYGALYFSERLVRPVQDLIAGTRAVAKGDFDTRLLRPSHDEIGFLVTSFNDMTKKLARAREETERSRAAVEAERAALAVILARLTSGVISLEPDLRVRVANQAAGQHPRRRFRRQRRAVRSRRSRPGSRCSRNCTRCCSDTSSAGETEWREQVTLRADTGRRELVVACTALPGDAGAQGLVLVFDEVTQLLQAQRQAAWGEVARRLAHEIRNPLTPIQLSAERMRRKLMSGLGAAEAELLDRSTQTIVQQVEAMKQMVAAFSEYAKAPEMHVSEFDLGALVRQVSDLYHAQDSRVAFGLSLDPKAALLEADPGRIRQLLNNLLTNSLEALDGQPNPVIMIETKRSGRPGRPHRRRQRARLPGRPARAGLRPVRDLEAEGHGARSRDRAPHHRGARRAGRGRQCAAGRRAGAHHVAGDRARGASHRGEERESMSSPRILVVDDEADIRGLLSEILAEEGYEIEVAADAASARRAAARQEPDLVLLDIWMPDMDGITLLREWNEKNTLRCPVVMLSGHGTVETAVEATRLGAFDFVEKPLSIAKLLRTAERALEAGKRRRQAQRTLIPSLVAPVGKSRVMQKLREQVQKVAGHDASVMLVGEPGTGREAFARYMHALGPARRRPLRRSHLCEPRRRHRRGAAARETGGRQARSRAPTSRRGAARCSSAVSRT